MDSTLFLTEGDEECIMEVLVDPEIIVIESDEEGVVFSSARQKRFTDPVKKAIFTKKMPLKRNLSCQLCGYRTQKWCVLRSHIRAKHGNPEMKKVSRVGYDLRCLHCCNFVATRLPELKEHITKYHPGLRRFKCSSCNYSAWKRRELDEHTRVRHTYEKPFQCKLCEYKSSRMSCIREHMVRKHRGEPPFRCPFCSYGSLRTASMKKHIQREHLEDHPHKCTDCAMSFVSGTNLRRHIRAKHGHQDSLPSTCPQWELDPLLGTNLHNRPFKCTFCPEGFFLPHLLNRHIQVTHLCQENFGAYFGHVPNCI